MSYNQNYVRITQVQEAVVGAALDDLIDTYLKGMPDSEIIATFNLTQYQITSWRERRHLSFRDVVELCAALGLDVAVSIRNHDGKEVTYYPKSNFGPSSPLPGPTKPAVEEVVISPAAFSAGLADEYGD